MRGTLDKRMIIARLVQSGPPKCAPLMRGSDPHESGRRASCIRRRALPAGAAGRPRCWLARSRSHAEFRAARPGGWRSPRHRLGRKETPVPAAEPPRHQRRHDRLHGRPVFIHAPAPGPDLDRGRSGHPTPLLPAPASQRSCAGAQRASAMIARTNSVGIVGQVVWCDGVDRAWRQPRNQAVSAGPTGNSRSRSGRRSRPSRCAAVSVKLPWLNRVRLK